MKVALSLCAEVRLGTLPWLRVGPYRDDATYIFVFWHYPRCRTTLDLPDNFLNMLWLRVGPYLTGMMLIIFLRSDTIYGVEQPLIYQIIF